MLSCERPTLSPQIFQLAATWYCVDRWNAGSNSALSSKPRPFLTSFQSGSHVLTGGIQGSTLSSNPRPFPHKFSVWPLMWYWVDWWNAGSSSEPSSKPRPFPHKFSVWPLMWYWVDWWNAGSSSGMSSKHHLFPHKLSVWPPRVDWWSTGFRSKL